MFPFRRKTLTRISGDVEEFSEERYLMSAVVVDTHAIVWYLEGDPRLSVKAAAALDQATSGGEAIHVPSVCLPG